MSLCCEEFKRGKNVYLMLEVYGVRDVVYGVGDVLYGDGEVVHGDGEVMYVGCELL